MFTLFKSFTEALRLKLLTPEVEQAKTVLSKLGGQSEFNTKLLELSNSENIVEVEENKS